MLQVAAVAFVLAGKPVDLALAKLFEIAEKLVEMVPDLPKLDLELLLGKSQKLYHVSCQNEDSHSFIRCRKSSLVSSDILLHIS